MKRAAVIAVLLLAGAVCAFAQSPDRERIDSVMNQTATRQKAGIEHVIRRNLAGACHYYPCCAEYFGQAVREIGFFPALFSFADRITRCSTIGTASSQHKREDDGLIHEGTEPYGKKRKAE